MHKRGGYTMTWQTRHDTTRSSVLSFNLNKFFHLLPYSSRLPSTFIVSGLVCWNRNWYLATATMTMMMIVPLQQRHGGWTWILYAIIINVSFSPWVEGQAAERRWLSLSLSSLNGRSQWLFRHIMAMTTTTARMYILHPRERAAPHGRTSLPRLE